MYSTTNIIRYTECLSAKKVLSKKSKVQYLAGVVLNSD
jgi:hypothetical protein